MQRDNVSSALPGGIWPERLVDYAVRHRDDLPPRE